MKSLVTSLLFFLPLLCSCSEKEDASSPDKAPAGGSGGVELNTTGGYTGNGDPVEQSGGATRNGSGGAGQANGGALEMGGQVSTLPTEIEFTYDPEKDTPPVVCASRALETQEVSLDVFLILDKSGSMIQGATSEDACPIGISSKVGSRWCNAIVALDGFFEGPSSIGLGFAYSYFATTGCQAFEQMDVPFGLIQAGDANGQLRLFRDQLNTTSPTGDTYTEGAVRTLIEQTEAHIPGDARRTVAVLITDGSPSRCLGGSTEIEVGPSELEGAELERLQAAEVSELNALLQEHKENTGIPTFVVGMTGAVTKDLEGLAVNAGAERHPDYCLSPETECSYYSVGDGDPAVFVEALDTIRNVVVGCQYAIPAAETGLTRLETLEVKLTQNDSSAAVILQRVAHLAACTSAAQYWLDDSLESGAVVQLCPATCELRTDDSKVELALRCEGS
jgi:hypothetical protein